MKKISILLILMLVFSATIVSFADPLDDIGNMVKNLDKEQIKEGINKVENVVESGIEKIIDIANHWARPYIEKLMDSGSIKGDPDGTFKPENPIKKGEFTKIFITSVTDDDPGNSDSSHWANNYHDMAIEKGYIKQGEFNNLDKNITRAEIARMISRALDKEPENIDKLKGRITDFNIIDSDYKNHVARVFAAGIITGYEDGSFRPSGEANRAEASTMLVRLLEEGERKIPEVKEDKNIEKIDSSKVIEGDHYKFTGDKLYYKDNNGRLVDMTTNSTLMTEKDLIWYFKTMYDFAKENDLYFTTSFSEESSSFTFWVALSKSNFEDKMKMAYISISGTNNGNIQGMDKIGKNISIISDNLTNRASHLAKVDVKPYLEVSKKIIKHFTEDKYTEEHYNVYEKFTLNKVNGDTNSEYYGPIKRAYKVINDINTSISSSSGYAIRYNLYNK